MSKPRTGINRSPIEGAWIRKFPNGMGTLRVDKGLTQESVAVELGIPRGIYSSIESGYFVPSGRALDVLCQFYSRTSEQLYGRTDIFG